MLSPHSTEWSELDSTHGTNACEERDDGEASIPRQRRLPRRVEAAG